MTTLLIVTLALYLYYGIGIMMLSKALGMKYWYISFLPFVSFYFMGKISGPFKVLSVPVKKSLPFFIEVHAVLIVCVLYMMFVGRNFTGDAVRWCNEIMYVPITVCYFVIYLSTIKCSMRIYRRFNVEKLLLYNLLSILIVPIPILFILIRNRETMKLEEMFF